MGIGVQFWEGPSPVVPSPPTKLSDTSCRPVVRPRHVSGLETTLTRCSARRGLVAFACTLAALLSGPLPVHAQEEDAPIYTWADTETVEVSSDMMNPAAQSPLVLTIREGESAPTTCGSASSRWPAAGGSACTSTDTSATTANTLTRAFGGHRRSAGRSKERSPQQMIRLGRQRSGAASQYIPRTIPTQRTTRS